MCYIAFVIESQLQKELNIREIEMKDLQEALKMLYTSTNPIKNKLANLVGDGWIISKMADGVYEVNNNGYYFRIAITDEQISIDVNGAELLVNHSYGDSNIHKELLSYFETYYKTQREKHIKLCTWLGLIEQESCE